VGRSYDTVSFLSDFGTADEFVGVVKAVIRDLARHVTVLDLTHEIPPHDVRAGSLALVRAIQYLPSGVVVAVVDPGVGTQRRAIAVEVAGGEGVLVGPDNGLLAPAAAMAGGAERAVSLTDTTYHLAAPGATFAGRDVFAPVAAHLCNGVDLTELGEAVDPVTLLPQVVPVSREEGGELVGEVLWVDRFGNAQLNVGPEEVDGWGDQIQLRFGDTVRTGTVVGSYGQIGGGIGLVVDSYGLLAVSLDRRSAADELHLGAGDEVRLARLDEPDRGGVATPVSFRRRS
jgi:S-adenosylmethionine hydrolase